MKYIVLYDYDHFDCGGYGREFFSTKEEATDFIEKKLRTTDIDQNNIKNYQIFEGRELKLCKVETVTKIKATLD